MSKKALLMILDGWGIGTQGKEDVIFNPNSVLGQFVGQLSALSVAG